MIATDCACQPLLKVLTWIVFLILGAETVVLCQHLISLKMEDILDSARSPESHFHIHAYRSAASIDIHILTTIALGLPVFLCF